MQLLAYEISARLQVYAKIVRRMRLGAILLLACVVEAQAPPDSPMPAAAPKAETPSQPVLHNDGKPMVIPFSCTDDDMQWAGMTCSEEQPCPVYVELSALETAGNRLIVAGNIHTESVTLDSLLLLSEDGGVTWHEPYERMRGVGLDHIQLIDFQNGWISGETLVPVSRDPFLLITSDGGQSWRLRPIVGDGIGGAIQQFHFDSAKDGTLVLDRKESADSSRYELYETPNGGETWIIRRTSDKPLTISDASTDAASGNWRIHADARTKSFAIEKRQDDHWSTAASFLIQIGVCKPVPHPAAAPPPEGDTDKPENLPTFKIKPPKQ